MTLLSKHMLIRSLSTKGTKDEAEAFSLHNTLKPLSPEKELLTLIHHLMIRQHSSGVLAP